MSQQSSLRQLVIICAIVGALVLSIGLSALYYFQSKSQAQAIRQKDILDKSKALSFPTNETALKALFGVSDPSGKVRSATDKLTSFWFEQSFELGTDNLHVKFFATQSLDQSGQPIESHAQAVEVSAITYKYTSGQWEAISKQLQFGLAGSWGRVNQVEPELLKLSPSSLALMIDAADGMGGRSQEGKVIFVFAQDSWHDVGFVQTGENNLGACDDTAPAVDDEYPLEPCYSFIGKISVANGSIADYPDLLVTRSSTENKETLGALIPVRNVTYIFKDGKYSEPNHPE